MTTQTTSEIVRTIADQINSIRGMHPSMRLVVIDETTLRVHTKRGRIVRNVDISYDAALDLYNVAVHTFSAPSYEVTTKTTEGVFADSLENFFPERVILHSR